MEDIVVNVGGIAINWFGLIYIAISLIVLVVAGRYIARQPVDENDALDMPITRAFAAFLIMVLWPIIAIGGIFWVAGIMFFTQEEG